MVTIDRMQRHQLLRWKNGRKSCNLDIPIVDVTSTVSGAKQQRKRRFDILCLRASAFGPEEEWASCSLCVAIESVSKKGHRDVVIECSTKGEVVYLYKYMYVYARM